MTLDHLGLIVADLTTGRTFLEQTLGITLWTPVTHDPGLGVSVQFGTDENKSLTYELIAPLGEASPIANALRGNKNILNHLAYLTPDLAASGEHLRANGCHPIADPAPALAYDGNLIQFYVSPLRFILELIEKPNHQHVFTRRSILDSQPSAEKANNEPVPAQSKALFLDRDGVINHDIGFLHRPEDVRLLDGLIPLCLTAQILGYKLIVVTNQSGIGRGLYTEDDFEAVMRHIRAELQPHGITLDAVYHCPYHPREGLGDYKREHEDRKPSPGMIHRGAREFNLDLTQYVLIGDRCTDIGAANAAGLLQAFHIAGTEPAPCLGEALAIDSLAEAESWLLRNAVPARTKPYGSSASANA
jgi:D-glycero-D-manno-heptose 1,7-bisphosphate phosphatase